MPTKMAKIFWLKSALLDIEDICNFISTQNPRSTIMVLNRIEEMANLLVEFADLGRINTRHKTRELVIPNLPYIIVYRQKSGNIEILAILHTSRNRPKAHH